MNILIREFFTGLLWATIVLFVIFIHYTVCIDVPEFRYIGF